MIYKLSINGAYAADKAIQALDSRGKAEVTQGRITLKIRQSRSNGGWGEELGKSFLAIVQLPVPNYGGGPPKTITRRATSREQLRRFLSHGYNEAFQELKQQTANELFFEKWDKITTPLQTDKAFVEAIDKAEKESGCTSIYSDMIDKDRTFWGEWLTQYLAKREKK